MDMDLRISCYFLVILIVQVYCLLSISYVIGMRYIEKVLQENEGIHSLIFMCAMSGTKLKASQVKGNPLNFIVQLFSSFCVPGSQVKILKVFDLQNNTLKSVLIGPPHPSF